MPSFSPLWPGGPLFAPARHAPLSTDSVLLADFVRLSGVRRGIDLGCGSGILALLLLSRSQRLEMTGLELLEEAASLARENLSANGLEARAGILTGDVRTVRERFRPGGFDLAVSNPPYFPTGSGALSPDPDRALARSEQSCSLEELCDAAAWLCREGGRFCLVHKPEQLSRIFCTLSARGLEPKRLRLVCPRPGSAPSLVLIEARRAGKPGLVIEPELILRDPDGRETEEARRIYHRDALET